MEKRVWTRIIALSGLFFIGFLSCKKSPPPKPIPITPLQTFVNADTSLTLFHEMLLDANDAALLADSSISLLIPTNAVLIQAGYNAVTIDSSSSSALDRMLRYTYVLSPTLTPGAGAYTSYPTLLGASLYAEQDSTAGLFLLNGGTTVNSTPLMVGKASVYYLNSLLPPASDSLPELLQSDSTLTFFATALALTNLYDSTLLTGSYTILAPTDSVFLFAGYDSLGAIDSSNIESLFQLVQAHVLKGIYFTNNFPVPGPVYNVLDDAVIVGNANGGLQFSDSLGSGQAVWLSGNQVAGTNIVLHKIGSLLSPLGPNLRPPSPYNPRPGQPPRTGP